MSMTYFLWDATCNEIISLLPEQEQVIMGRSDDADLPFRDESLSGSHCLFEYKGGKWILADLGSTNGTRLNNKKVLSDGPQPLSPYCVVTAGDQVLVFMDESVGKLNDRTIFLDKIEDQMKDPDAMDVIKKKSIIFFKTHHKRIAKEVKLARIDGKIQKGLKLRAEKVGAIDDNIRKIQQEAQEKIAKLQTEKDKILAQLEPQLAELNRQREEILQESTDTDIRTNTNIDAGKTGTEN